MLVTTLGIDLAKSVFHVHGVDSRGVEVLRKKLSRQKLCEFMANLPRCLVGMEACGSSHFWARKFLEMGHEVRLMNPRFVTPYVKSNKNDYTDAEAICEAVTRPNMRFVPVKSEEQLAVLAVHRSRQRAVKARTALANQARGVLLEHGIAIPKGTTHLKRHLAALSDSESLCHLVRELIGEWLRQLDFLNEEIDHHEHRLNRFHRGSEDSQRLATIPGVGPITATALVASIGDASVFRNGRQMAAYLGLVPRQYSTGGRQVLLGISKRGDRYLRTLLVHGARAVVSHCAKPGRHYERARDLKHRRHPNIAAVALANRNARTAWALLTTKEKYKAA